MFREDHQEIDWELIRKHITGEISETEQWQLEKWMEGDELRRRFVEHARYYYLREDFPLPDEKRVDSAWRHFRQQMYKKRQRRIYAFIFRMAAVFVVAIGLLWMWDSGARHNLSESPPRIWPAHQKALLTLSDGSTVHLNVEEEKKVIKDHEVEIGLQGKGLVYAPGTQKADTLWNSVTVPQGGEYHLVLSDGTQIWLNAETHLTYPVTFGGSERRVHLEGEAYFKVMPNGKRFVVETMGSEVEVLGTSFNVQAYAEEEAVVTTLVEGKVKIAAGKEVCVLHSGEQARKEVREDKIKVQRVNTLYYVQWKEGYFSFRDDRLKDIMRVLARWYNMEYEFEASELKEVRFFGQLSRYQDMVELLKEFERTGKVKFRYEGRKVKVCAE